MTTYGMDLSSQFAGKVVVVTGATQGIGEAAARLMAQRGAQAIVLCGRNGANGAKICSELNGNTDSQVKYVRTDLSVVADCRALLEITDDNFGTVDILLNCAGETSRGSIIDTSPELFDKLFAVNVRAPFFLIQDVAKIMMRDNHGGAIASITSMAAWGGQPKIAAYSASKAALMTLTRNVAFGLLRHGIRVNALNIGWTETPGEHRVQTKVEGHPDNWLELAQSHLPAGRLIQVEEVARALAYLVSEESGLMTGSLVDFDQSVVGSYESPPEPYPLD